MQGKNLFTIIYSYRNRDVERFERSLESLERQAEKDFSVIIVDYGSFEAYSVKLKDIIKKFKFCTYIYTDTKGYPWNKSNALNIGLKNANSHYIIINDIDIVWNANLLSNLKKIISKDKVVFPTTYFLKKGFNDFENLEKYKSKKNKGTKSACGIHCVSKSVLDRMNGYDEFYSYWGVEDRDVKLRYNLLRLNEIWDESLYQFHQWHQTNNDSSHNYMPIGLWYRNELHFFENKNVIKRNNDEWGKIVKTKDRFVYKYLNFEDNKIIESKEMRIIKYKVSADNSSSISKFLENFFYLKSGEALCIPDYFYPKNNILLTALIDIINFVFRKLKIPIGIDYQKNFIHSYIFQFIQLNKKYIADYYLGFPDKSLNGVSILIKK